MGADRLVNAVAAHERYKGALIVVDFGTATTFDIVGGERRLRRRRHRAGRQSVGRGAAQARRHAAARRGRQRTQSVIGKDTVPAMQSGLYWGYIGLIEGLVARIKEEYGKPMTVIATGGLAKLFYKQTPVIDHLDPDLTIRGLIQIHARKRAREGETRR